MYLYIATPGTSGTYGICLAKEPRPALKTEILGRKRAHRAYVRQVTLVVVLQRLAFERTYQGVVSPVEYAHLLFPCNLLAKSHASGTGNAPFYIKHYLRAKVNPLWFMHLVVLGPEPALVQAEFRIVVLELTLPGLIADGTVHRMVQKKQLKHTFSGLLHLRCAGKHNHVVFNRVGARGHEFRRILYLYQTHPAGINNG